MWDKSPLITFPPPLLRQVRLVGSPGVLHGSFSYLLQDSEGQIIDPHSISAG